MRFLNFLFKRSPQQGLQEEFISQVFCLDDQQYAERFYTTFQDRKSARDGIIAVKTDLWPETWPEYLEGWPHDGYFGDIWFYFPPIKSDNYWTIAIDEEGEHFTLQMDSSTGEIYFVEIEDEFVNEMARRLGVENNSDNSQSSKFMIAKSFTDLCNQLNYTI